MNDLLPCDNKVFRRGTVVSIYGNCIPSVMEMACREVTRITGHKTDWNFDSGRAVVRTLGDPKKVHEFLEEILVAGVPPGCLRINDER